MQLCREPPDAGCTTQRSRRSRALSRSRTPTTPCPLRNLPQPQRCPMHSGCRPPTQTSISRVSKITRTLLADLRYSTVSTVYSFSSSGKAIFASILLRIPGDSRYRLICSELIKVDRTAQNSYECYTLVYGTYNYYIHT